jgi:hypothetical protein
VNLPLPPQPISEPPRPRRTRAVIIGALVLAVLAALLWLLTR